MFEFSRFDMGNNTWEPGTVGEKKKSKTQGERKGEERRGEKRKEVVFLKKIIGKHGKPQD